MNTYIYIDRFHPKAEDVLLNEYDGHIAHKSFARLVFVLSSICIRYKYCTKEGMWALRLSLSIQTETEPRRPSQHTD